MATMFAHSITSDKITKGYFDGLCLEIEKGNFANMDLMHHLTSGGKSVHTQECQDALFLIRQSLGGAGYSAWSGIPYLIDSYSPEVTYEGDNTVMAQQSFNYLKKLMEKAKKGIIKEKGYFEYLNEIQLLCGMKCAARDHVYFLSVENIHTALKVNLAVKI